MWRTQGVCASQLTGGVHYKQNEVTLVMESSRHTSHFTPCRALTQEKTSGQPIARDKTQELWLQDQAQSPTIMALKQAQSPNVVALNHQRHNCGGKSYRRTIIKAVKFGYKGVIYNYYYVPCYNSYNSEHHGFNSTKIMDPVTYFKIR